MVISVFSYEYMSTKFFLVNNGENFGLYGADINARGTLANHGAGMGVKVGVFATGCDKNGKQYIQSECKYDYFRNKMNTCGDLKHDGSGTTISGILGANYSNECAYGMVPKVNIMCYQIVSDISSYPSINSLKDALERDDQLLTIKMFPFSLDNSLRETFVHKYQDGEHKMISNSIPFGRGGLGTIALFASQSTNGIGDDPNYHFFTQTRFALNAGASTFRGDCAFYSPKSSNLLFNVPSTDSSLYVSTNITTNPIFGPGISNNVCSSIIRRNSAATTVATGALSLILEGNNGVSLRGLQLVIALSAIKNDPSHPSWIVNAEGYHYSNLYGFGRINVDKSRELLESFSKLPDELIAKSAKAHGNAFVPSCRDGSLNVTHDIESKIGFIESIGLEISMKHNRIGDLRIELMSPSGTRVIVSDFSSTKSDGNEINTYYFTIRQFLGESSQGRWTLFVSPSGCIEIGRISKTSLMIFGMKSLPNRPEHKKPKTQIVKPLYPHRPEIEFTINAPNPYFLVPTTFSAYIKITNENKDLPASIFLANTLTNDSIISWNLAKLSDIQSKSFFIPQIFPNNTSVNAIIEIYQNDFVVLSAHSGPWYIVSSNSSLKQYQIYDTSSNPATISCNISLPPNQNMLYTHHVLISVSDIYSKQVLDSWIDTISQPLSYKLPLGTHVEWGIISISPLSSQLISPCDTQMITFSTNPKYSDSPFLLNHTGVCAQINGIEYSEPIIHTIPQTDQFTPTVVPITNHSTNSGNINTSNQDLKEIFFISGTIFSIVLVSAIALIVCKKANQEDNIWDHQNDESITSE